MTRIAALNDWSLGSSEEEDIGPTREALEAQATKSYNEAIRYLAHGNLEDAQEYFCQVLQNPYIEKACWPEGVEPGGVLPQDLALRYSCLKNLGNLAVKQGDNDQAAKYYLEAVQLDNTEVTLWQRLGATAIKLKDFELALVAFQEGLNVNPKHWPCLDQLLSVLFILEMYMDCLGLSISALHRDPGYIKANAFKDKIFELQPSLTQDVKFFYHDSSILFKGVDYDKAIGDKFIATCEALRPPCKVLRPPSPLQLQQLRKPMSKLSWADLGQALILTYDRLVDADGLEFAARIDVFDALKPKEEKNSENDIETKKKETLEDTNAETEAFQEGKSDVSLQNREEKEMDANNRKEKHGTSKNDEENDPNHKCQDGKRDGKPEDKNDLDKCLNSEEKWNVCVPKLQEGFQGSPLRISSRRCTIELGESQDSFRVGEKRRSIDSDTFSRPDDDWKGSEEDDNQPVEAIVTGAVKNDLEHAKSDWMNSHKDSIQDMLKDAEASGKTSPSKSTGVAKEITPNEDSLQKKDINVDCKVDETVMKDVVTSKGKNSETQECTGELDSYKKILNVSVESENDFQGFASGVTDEDKFKNLVQEKSILETVAVNNKEVEKQDEGNKVVSNSEVLSEMISVALSTTENFEFPKSLSKDEDIDHKERDISEENLNDISPIEKVVVPSNDINIRSVENYKEIEKESSFPQDLDKENRNTSSKNPTDDGLSGDGNKMDQITEDIIVPADIHGEEAVLLCGGFELEDEDAEEVEEDKQDEEEEEVEAEPEEGDEDGGSGENELLQEEEEGLEEEGVMSSEVTETEAAVNALKGIMALQPTEILGLPETDFDYDSEYVEYFDGGVYEEEEEEDMGQEDVMDGEEGMDQEEGLNQGEGMEHEGTDQEEGTEQEEGIEQEGADQEEGTEHEGMDQEDGMDQDDGMDQEGIDQEEGIEQEEEDTQDEGSEQEEANAMEEDLEEQDETEREGVEETEEDRDAEEEDEEGQENESQEENNGETQILKKKKQEGGESTEENKNDCESGTAHLENDMGSKNNVTENQVEKVKANKTAEEKSASNLQNGQPDAADENVVAEASDKTEESQSQTSVGASRKSKRHKRGLERELEQLDYWGRRQERDAKRRRRTISSKLLGTVEEAEYLTWGDLFRSFVPASLVNVSTDDKTRRKTLQQNPQQDTISNCSSTPAAVSNIQGTTTDQPGGTPDGPCDNKLGPVKIVSSNTNSNCKNITNNDRSGNINDTVVVTSNIDSQNNNSKEGNAAEEERISPSAKSKEKISISPDNTDPTSKSLEMDPGTVKPEGSTTAEVSDAQEKMDVHEVPVSETPKKCTAKDECKDSNAEIRKKRDEVIINSSSEEEQVEAFLMRHEENGGILDLSQQFLRILLKKHGKLWPVMAAKMFIEMYPRVRNHVFHGSALSLKEDQIRLYQDSILSLTHWELVVSLHLSSKSSHTSARNKIFTENCHHLEDDLVHLMLMLGRGDVWVEETPQFHTRLRWLQSQIKLCQDEPEDAVLYLKLLLSDLECITDVGADYVVDRVRIETDTTVVCNSEVKRQLNFLQRSQMLEQVVDNYTDGRYRLVADLLTTIFHEAPPKPRPGVTLPMRQTQLAILVDSLHKLNDHTEVIVWGAQSLAEALKRYNRAEAEEEKNRWAKTIMKISDTMNTTLENNITTIHDVDHERLIELVTTLIQILVIQLEKPQSAQVLPFETLTPWTLLHRLLAHEELLQKQVDKMKTQDTIEKRESSVSEDELGKTHQNLTQVVVSSVTPETKDCSKYQEKDTQEEEGTAESKGSGVPYPSTLFLITAHDELGKHSWCCYDDGVFLLYCLDVLLGELHRSLEDQHRQLLHHTLEQLSFCLYSHPSKKSKHKHLRDHGVPQIALCWDRALQLYQYYRPSHLPDFQSSQIPSITDDVATLHKRIIALLPAEARPENRISDVEAYINGEEKECNYTPFTPPTDIIRDCFYLLGDYYFKNKEWTTAIKYYKLDVTINPDRLDSWAPLGLAMKAMLETQLNSCEVIQDEEAFFSLAQAAVRCLKQALKLDEYHTNLWVEFGGLVYMVHSHASRLLKQDLNPDISLETFEMLEKLKGQMLSQAEQCFTKALDIRDEGWDDENLPDERWLYCYMLGKVAEKQSKSSEVILQNYLKAGEHLHQIQAKYPIKINYNSPQEYSVEALEMYYRPHAYMLKYLQQREGKCVEQDILKIFDKYLDKLAAGPFASCQEKKKVCDVGVSETLGNDGSTVTESPEIDESPVKRPIDEQENANEPPAKKVAINKESDDVSGIVKEVISGIVNDAVSESNHNLENMNTEKESDMKSGENTSAENKETVKEKTNSTPAASTAEKDKRDSDDEIQVVEEKVIEKKDHINIISRCITSLKLCLSRFPQNYKALYRLSYYYNTSKFYKDCSRARNYLLGCDYWQRVGYMPVNGLFNERKVWIQQPKNSNFFHGVWRIPNDEVDRPGSFAAHMYRCVSLTLDILPQMKDFFPVLQIALALKNSPEKDKKYLRDNERELLSEHATQVGLQAMKDKYKVFFKGASPVHANRRLAFLLDVYRSYKQISKHLPGSEPHLAKMLSEAYAAYRGIKPDSRSNILREADAFCSRNQHFQHRIAPVVPSIQGSTNISVSGDSLMSRRGRPPGTGRGRGRGSMYPLRQSPGIIAIQEAYKIYENLIQAQTILNNKELDHAALYTHQKELEYFQSELLKYLRIPSVSQYFQASLQGLGTATAKLPPPPKNSATSGGNTSGRQGANIATQILSTAHTNQATQPTRPDEPRSSLSALSARSQVHGISITSVPASKSTLVTSKPLKPSMSVTVSPAKTACPPALQGRGDISVVSVSRPTASSRTTVTATTTSVSKQTTCKTVSPTTPLPRPTAIRATTSSAPSSKTPASEAITLSTNTSKTATSTVSSVPKLPAGTTLTRPSDTSVNRGSAPRPQLQAQARPANNLVSDSPAKSLTGSIRNVPAEILSSTGAPITRPTTVLSNTKSTNSVQASKPSLPKDMTITPAPRVKSTPAPRVKAHPKPQLSVNRTTPSSSFLGAYQASLGLIGTKNSPARVSGSNNPRSMNTTTTGSDGQHPSSSQSNKSVRVTHLNTSQLMQLAYGKGGTGNVSGVISQLTKTPQPVRGQSRTPASMTNQPQTSMPQRSQASSSQRPQVSGSQRPQPSGTQRPQSSVPQRPQGNPSQRSHSRTIPQTRPGQAQMRPSTSKPNQTKPGPGQGGSSDDIITLD
ncbi:uncharacterized protein LOC121855286 isoform X2 [Homarus americanus]|uniref:uncharacterized protein LOC121855286 isoform X2 n=1 Tax=Homarus americanus TaxID=6706 RepID=UPI001C494B69|nr:uncharacterized protein LOC121855286 isoform X2 [Homarus americanus]